MLAEIAGAPTPEALAIVNANRDRAELGPLTGVNSIEDFREAILRERWDDLVRTNTFKEGLAAAGITVDDNYKYFPLPQSQRDLLGDEMLPQNPGYSF